jgi:aspartyl-tRNA(Asn)/glutamyl-tRNA(Gln) amidotransferase subunit A
MKNKTITELNKRFVQNEKTSTEILRDYEQKIDTTEPKMNALVTKTFDQARDQAKSADERIKKGEIRSLLDGSIATIKDVFCTEKIRTTASSKMLDNFVPPYDATVVRKLKEAGVIIVGKNNCDAWAHGASTENSDYGVTKNPWDLTRVSGGSSGGSAAAVAAGECTFSIGSDTGGSIRQPAGFCGVVGLKPTYGRVSRYGLISMASSLDCVGPITNTVEDAAIVMEVIAGHDAKDSTSVDLPVPEYTKKLSDSVKGKKIGWAKEFFELGLDDEIKTAMKEARKTYEKMGAEFVDITLPNIKYGVPVYYIIQPAEVSSNLGRFDGIKYGYTARDANNLIEEYFKSRDEGFGDEAKRRIMLGTFVLSAGFYDAYYNKAMKVRTLIKNDFDKAFEKVDVVLSPVSPTTAFAIGENSDDPLKMYLADVYTASINLAGNPSLSMPCGFDSNKLPIGMQLIGRHFDEETILNFGYQFEKETEDEQWRKMEVKL